MSWLEKILPPKIRKTDTAARHQIPEGLWLKCPSCSTVLYKTDLEQNQFVCPHCSHHNCVAARIRLGLFLDEGERHEIGQTSCPPMP